MNEIFFKKKYRSMRFSYKKFTWERNEKKNPLNAMSQSADGISLSDQHTN